MATDTVLKPCPFCGRVPHMVGHTAIDYYDGEWAEQARVEFWVSPDCKLTCLLGRMYNRAFGIMRGVTYVSVEAAAKAWKERWEP